MKQLDPWKMLAGKLRALAEEVERGPSPYPLRSGTSDDQTWTITLSRYHRDNLIQLFNAIGYPWGNPKADKNMADWNTGDWVGEIPIMLARTDGSYTLDAKDNPNPRPAWTGATVELSNLREALRYCETHHEPRVGEAIPSAPSTSSRAAASDANDPSEPS